jgi:cyanophycin synthetase
VPVQLADARRLTGPNFLSRVPLVVVEFETADSREHAPVLQAYQGELARAAQTLGIAPIAQPSDFVTHAHKGGLLVGYPAPIDTMLAMAEISEWAGKSACEIVDAKAPLPLAEVVPALKGMLQAQDNPNLRALQAEARARGLPLLFDDAQITVGTGRLSASFELGAVPTVDAVPWDSLGAIPVALVTGTNGKTTSSRWLAHVCTAAGQKVGTTSTDGVSIGGVVHAEGDWTGPAGARTVLRSHEVDVAILETARGGILRRGLAVDNVQAALITNVSADHFGAYGIDDLEAMVRAKGVVAHAVRQGGTVVLNASDESLVRLGTGLAGRVVFFADVDGGAPRGAQVAMEHARRGGTVALAIDGRVELRSPAGTVDLGAVADLPLTFQGRARYNVENALGVVAMAQALGIAEAYIARGLGTFGMADNPGRGQLVRVNGVQVLIDFGHNPEGVRGLMNLANELKGEGGRLFIITGAAGDRSNADIDALCEVLVQAAPARVMVRELHDYLRGRILGEVPQVFQRAFEVRGYPSSSFSFASSEVLALEACLAQARVGDVVALLVHVERDPVEAFLREQTSGAP